MSASARQFNSHPFPYHTQLQFTIVDITSLGLGVGRVSLPGGDTPWVVMVPFVAIGEVVVARIYRNFASYSLADLVEVLSPSSSRVVPACPLFTRCGGCQYQHLSYSHQLSLKQQQLASIYRTVAQLQVSPLPTLPSPTPYGYRTKLTPHYRPVRKVVADQPTPVTPVPWPIGFLSAHSMALVDVPACPIATSAINDALPALRAATTARRDTFRREGTLLLRDTLSGVITDPRATATQQVHGIRYQFIAGEFFQVNQAMLPTFVDAVISAIVGQYVIDAYCGVGFFALQAARRSIQVAGVEVSAAAIDMARLNATANGIANVQFIAASAEAIFSSVSFPPASTTVIIDPPRAGCTADFLSQLLALRPARLIYVACDAATQARDARILIQGGYRLTSLQPIDLFPQTRHIEAIAIFDLA